MQQISKILIITGLILVVAGIILWLLHGKFGWFGNLPGDIKIKKENFSFYAPITTMIIVSIILSLIFWGIQKLLK